MSTRDAVGWLLQMGLETSGRHSPAAQRQGGLVMFACVTLALLLSAPQPAEAQQTVVDELKAIRATLEKVEASQRMLLALIRIQIDEARLSPLERERQALAAHEGALNEELGALQATLQGVPQTTSLAVSDARADGLNDSQATRGQVDDVARRLEAVRRNLSALDRSIADARSRIAAWEKFFQDLMR